MGPGRRIGPSLFGQDSVGGRKPRFGRQAPGAGIAKRKPGGTSRRPQCVASRRRKKMKTMNRRAFLAAIPAAALTPVRAAEADFERIDTHTHLHPTITQLL